MTEMTTANPLLSKLNKQQQEAAMYTEGPLLILAGAGSGKTSTMTHRIAYMIEELHINPYQILAVTFTNKAAGEMRDRVEALVGEGLNMWILTFHSACLRILRKHAEVLGYGTDFAVYDPTDQKTVVKNIRNKITDLGGEIRFESKLTKIGISGGVVNYAEVNGDSKIETDNVILAIGHSARDTFEMLNDIGVKMERKPFAAGVRIEHRQESINTAQYGFFADKLPPADYMLTYTTKDGRGVYSFCMCPGGYVVSAASEKGRLAVNGMSEYARDGENANSALLVQVNPDDFGSDDVLAGIEFQRKIEEAAYKAGGEDYSAPVQRYGDFVDGRVTCCEGIVKHSYKPSIKFADLNEVLPEFISNSLKEAIPAMGRKLKGFDSPDALMTGVETRSSSPVRIVRDKQGVGIGIKGLYPTGEGAGYAGGIISAAVDGVRQAENVILNNTVKEDLND